MNSKRSLLYLLSFLEGGSVMICELVGAKMLAPFFGTSLYIWAAVLGLTLGGLTLGYFLGGRLSKKYADDERLLYYILAIAGFFLVMMPISSEWIMQATINMNLQLGAISSLFVFMFPPLVFMGMTSPVIINLLTEQAGNAGNNAGNVYAISTLGGILFTFLMGFYIIPEFGLTKPTIIAGFGLSFLPVFFLLKNKQKAISVLLILTLGMGLWKFNSTKVYADDYHVIYESEGILGQVKVVDHPAYEIVDDARIGRGLIVNNTLQTFVGIEDNYQYSLWNWDTYFPTAASIFPEGSEVLLLGLGGGTLVKQFKRMGFSVDAVEIDHRIRDVSIAYFGMDPATNVFIDDARHYIRTTQKQYDIIVFDTFLSESVPEHLLTKEGFNDANKLLKENGMIMINFYGFLDGEIGKAARSVYKTLTACDYEVELLATPGTEASRNLIFLASHQSKDFSKANYEEPGFKKIDNLYHYFIDPDEIQTDDAYVLIDDQPRLAKLYAEASLSWKKSYNAYYQKYFKKL